MSTAKYNKRPDYQHLMGIERSDVAAILFPVKDSFIKAQDERAPILLAIANYFTFKSLIVICILGWSARPADPQSLYRSQRCCPRPVSSPRQLT